MSTTGAPEPPLPRGNPDLFGQDRAATILWRSWRSGRLPHGWLIHGPPGIGKATLAFRFARALLANARSTPADAPNEQHPVFRMVAAGAHPDLHVIEPVRDTKGRLKSEIPVDTVRLVSASLHSTPAMGGHRVVVIDAAEQLNRNAANALLKPLEEPPRETVLLLISHHPARVLPTIRSRCAKLRCDRLAQTEVARVVRSVLPDLAPERLQALVQLAGGSPGRAFELEASGALDLCTQLLEALASGSQGRPALARLAGELAGRADRHGSAAPLALLQAVVGRIVAAGVGRPEPEIVPGEAATLDTLAAARPLDRWAGLWEKTARLATRADAVNLDRVQVYHHILTGLMPGDDEPAAWSGTPLGDSLGDPYGLA